MGRNTTNVYKASINILGSCIIRDSFCTHENDGGYKIFRYANLFSPLSLCEEAIPLDVDKYQNSDFSNYVTNFRKRCIFQDLTRTSIEFIEGVKTDWLVLDSALFRRNLYQIGEKKLTCFAEGKVFLDYLSKQKIIPPIVGEIKLEDMSDEEIERRLKFYIEKILSLYPVEKIILLEAKNCFLRCNKDNEMNIFGNKEEFITENKRMDRCYKLMKNMLKGCHIIPMPENVVADENHKLGKSPVHYTKEYYNYVIKAVDCIQEKLPREQEENNIEQLCREYSSLYAEKYFPLLSDSFIELKSQYTHSGLRNLYISYKLLFSKLSKKKKSKH